MIQQYITKKFISALEKITYGNLTVVTPDGKDYHFFGSEQPKVHLQINSWDVITNLAAKGDVGFTESYRDGLFETDNLVGLCQLALQNSQLLDQYLYGGSFFGIVSRLMYFFRANTLAGSQRNIHAHYDLGNDFYALWLDPTMSYSAAIFANEHDSLLQAQKNKYDRILNKLDKQNNNLLEIGCGWGGFADQATCKHDVNLKAITISPAQHQFASNLLGSRANIALEDYRKQTGKYDSVVSIEMFEAVGEKFWSVYFQKLQSLLKSKGKAVVQTITIGHQYFEQYKKTGDMFRTFIFPGGMLPSLQRFQQEASRANLQMVGVFEFGRDYARTLSHWLANFEAQLHKIKSMGFDEKFIRVWRFYLSACIAGFTEGRTNVMQTELVHA